MFNKEIYIRRRKALVEKMKGESRIIVFLGNVNAPAQYYDNCYKWRQDSTWLNFFGVNEPRCAATIDLDTGYECFFRDDYSLDDIIWSGPMPSTKELAESTGIENSAPYMVIQSYVGRARTQGRKLHFIPVSRHYNAIKMSHLMGILPADTLSHGKAGCIAASEPLVRAAIDLRLIKEDIEIAEMDKAADLGFKMHTTARKGIKPGRIEQEIVGEMEAETNKHGWGPSFPTILTQHGEIFHCHSHACPVMPGKLMVVDAGAEIDSGYASDFTRTYPTSGKFTGMQRDIYQTVYECNELAYGMIRPGASYLDCHLEVARHMLDNLKQLGLVSGDVDTMAEQGVAGLFMPHGLGHNIGLDVHDMEDYGEDLVGYDPDQKRSTQLGLGSLRMARVLKPGNVVTDEPGIYFIPALIENWRSMGACKDIINYSKLEAYYDFGGIRLEDDVLVTADGARRLGAQRLPIAPDDVENAMANE